MAKDNNDDGNGSLIIGLIILGMCVMVMIYCGICQMMDPAPPEPRDMSLDQRVYLRKVHQQSLVRLWYVARSKDRAPETEAGSIRHS
ncbi:hypothetical protein BDV29DRAFT_181976 [Aspergillus leporis]|jgi:hypothetical protein|uniref:Uncharacterized protein n=1 Tax=Aspergillus leporis TaxID=41062 RepID=A0A5N5WRY9_9EURO|nr:hypothetical protein BDV29DRAFT_181976 [Aspergillus leporis]